MDSKSSSSSINSEEQKIENLETYAVVCLGIAISTLCATLWIIISMIVYGRKKIRKRNAKHKRLYYVCFSTVVLTVPRQILHLLMLNELRHPGIFGDCEVIMDVSHVFGGLVIYVTYAFLWLRHRETFQHPALKKIRGGKYLSILSWGSITVLTILAVILICGYAIPDDYVLTKNGCNDVSIYSGGANTTSWSSARSFVTAGCMFLVQASLIFLFVYPLTINRHRPKSMSKKSSINRDKILATVRRSVISAVIASFTDFVVVVGVYIWVEWGYPPAITDTLLNLDPLINCICIMSTFKSFKDIFLVIYRRRTLAGTRQWNSTSSTQVGDTHQGLSQPRRSCDGLKTFGFESREVVDADENEDAPALETPPELHNKAPSCLSSKVKVIF